jgi:kynureninase
VPTSRSECLAFDAVDPFRATRERFDLPAGVIYLDGNSLGALPGSTIGHLRRVVHEQWGDGLITSWEGAGWWAKPVELGNRLAPLLGAAEGQVIVGDSTSVDLFKVLVAAARLRPGRSVIVSEAENFPTDLYLLESATELLGASTRLVARDPATIAASLDDNVAAVLLTHVDYRSADLLDMAAITEAAQRAGALMIFDLCHSVGAMPLHLDDAQVDFAVGCTYKYLNGGPGSPAFIYAAERHHSALRQPLAGWGGHAHPFDFAATYEPAPGIARFGSGTPSILALAALEASLQLFESLDLAAVREKSRILSELVIGLVDAAAPAGLSLASPREFAHRGSHLAYRHEKARALQRALAAEGVLADFRPPDLLRLGIAPLYVRAVDCYDAVQVLLSLLDSGDFAG